MAFTITNKQNNKFLLNSDAAISFFNLDNLTYFLNFILYIDNKLSSLPYATKFSLFDIEHRNKLPYCFNRSSLMIYSLFNIILLLSVGI